MTRHRPTRAQVSRAMRAWSLLHGPPEIKRAAAGKRATRENNTRGNKSTRRPKLAQRGLA